MHISFRTKKIRELCTSEIRARSELGEIRAKELFQCLADLRASNSIDDIIANPVEQIDNQQMMITFTKGCGLIFEQNHIKPDVLDDGEINWSTVTRIKLLRISNHDD